MTTDARAAAGAHDPRAGARVTGQRTAPPDGGERPVLLGPNQYGKAENRVVRITRDGATHHIKDLNVSVALSGDMADVHYTGSNAHVLTTDTTKNTVFAFAKEHGIESAEQFAIHLARHFVTSQDAIHRARIRIEEYAWERIGISGGEGDGSTPDGCPDARPASAPEDGTVPAPHSFVRSGRETRTTQVTFDGHTWEAVSGLRDLTVMNSTDSEFWGYTKDRYTTLPEAYDRILATRVSGCWRFGWSGEGPAPDWDESYARTRDHLLRAFAETYSLSLQQTLYQMGARVIDHRTEIDEVRLSLPNQHHFLVDLEPFGLANDNEVYIAADRPYGLIEGTVLRAGREARIPADLTSP
ncbi:factor-independent urate hydroxylase [Streptomyces sp. TS71-3]|uniref:factor-independent urate hydroxylase n=1 Tax=Streptomyces sp. TS71-3 TaxID=2733862 RepID=UPI001B0537DD|nr:urate oxidase [Streptomyces sp. TS71-3]GHJ41110.1 uricase [Streptomyces sp. TS71-3]